MSYLAFTIILIVGLSLAAFLVLFWALRGAPMGQAAEGDDIEEAPRSGYRDRVVAAAIVGLVLVAIGAYVAVAISIPWSLPLFIVGFGVVITLVSVNRRYRHASPTLRRVVYFTNTALVATLIAGILIVGNVMAFKYGGHPVDLTGDRAFSLSSQTINQLKHLDKPVKFTLFIAGPGPARRVWQLLELYKAENPAMITLDALDPFRDLTKFEALAKRVPDVAVTREQGGGVVIDYGEGEKADHLVVQGADLFDIPLPGEQQPRTDQFVSVFRGEDAITSALVRLRQGKKPLVLFTTGHGEPPTEQTERMQRGLGLLKARLQSIGSNVLDVNLMQNGVAPDVDLVVIVGPRTAFHPQEVERLKSYMDGGGHLLALVGNTTRSGLEDWLRTCNVEIGAGRVHEPTQQSPGQPYATFVAVTGINHPIVESLARQFVLLPNAAPLVIVGQAQANQNAGGGTPFVAQPLLRTSRRSWAETDLSDPRPQRNTDKDQPGPLTVGVAVVEVARASGGNQPDVRPKLVLFSSPEMADNPVLIQWPNNRDLLMNAVFWLRGKPELMGITPKTHVAPVFLADESLRMKLMIVPTVMAFVLIVAPGLLIYMSRRD